MLNRLIEKLVNEAKNYNLVLNQKKSGILLNKGHDKILRKGLYEIPIINGYNYLGIQINQYG